MAGVSLDLAWHNGKILKPVTPEVEGLFLEALLADAGCYTTALYREGTPLWSDRHARRLERDAQSLGLGAVDRGAVEAALRELGREAFGSGSGIVRVTAFRGRGGALELLAEVRDLTGEREHWRAIRSPYPFETGAADWTGAKGSNFAFYDRVRELLIENICEEVLLWDREGFVFEGCRSNILIVDSTGQLTAPNINRGAVAGLAQQLVHERVGEVVDRDVPLVELADVREIIAVNGVRLAVPIVEFDGKPVGTGEPGAWCRRLAEVLAH